MGIIGGKGNSLDNGEEFGQDMVGAKDQTKKNRMFDLTQLMQGDGSKMTGFSGQSVFNDPNRPMQTFNLMDIFR